MMVVTMADGNDTMSEYPMVVVQDCATNPEHIDPAAEWVVQHAANETMIAGVVRQKTDLDTRFTWTFRVYYTLLQFLGFMHGTFLLRGTR